MHSGQPSNPLAPDLRTIEPDKLTVRSQWEVRAALAAESAGVKLRFTRIRFCNGVAHRRDGATLQVPVALPHRPDKPLRSFFSGKDHICLLLTGSGVYLSVIGR